MRRTKKIASCVATIVALVAAAERAGAQSAVTTMTLGPDQIGLVRTAQGLSTRISLPEPVKEIICGDLYDPASGKGSFVVQRGENDVFLKPITSKGMSNLFVKTGDKGEHVYNFDLVIASTAQAFRVVNVLAPGGKPAGRGEEQAADQTGGDTQSRRTEPDQQAQQGAEEILQKARAQAGKVVSDAERQAASIQQEATRRAEEEIERRFVNALMLGVREAKINNPRAMARKVVITLDPHLLTFGDKSYLRYTIQNNGDTPFSFGVISIETRPDSPISAEVIQSKTENKISPGESMGGIIVFDAKLVGAHDKLTLLVRGENKTEIAHLNVIQ